MLRHHSIQLLLKPQFGMVVTYPPEKLIHTQQSHTILKHTGGIRKPRCPVGPRTTSRSELNRLHSSSICFNIVCCFRFPRYYLLRCVDSTCLTASPRTCSATTRLSLADTGWTHISSIRASARQHYHIETYYPQDWYLRGSRFLPQL